MTKESWRTEDELSFREAKGALGGLGVASTNLEKDFLSANAFGGP